MRTTAKDPGSSTQGADRDVPDAQNQTIELRTFGGPWLLWVTLALRLPQVLGSLGVLTWVAVTTSSAWTAALCAAGLSLGSVLSGVLVAFFARIRWFLLALTLTQGVSMWLLLGVDLTAEPGIAVLARQVLPFFLVGLSLPPMGLMARARWATVLEHSGRPDLFPHAMRKESINEVMAMVVGAVITGALTVTVGPEWVLRFSAVLSVLMSLGFLTHPSARWSQTDVPFEFSIRLRDWTLARLMSAQSLRRLLVVGMFSVAVMFGAVQGCLVVFTQSLDIAASMGVMYASFGLMSTVGAMVAVSKRLVLAPRHVWVLAGTCAVLSSMLLSGAKNAVVFAVVLGLMGLCVGPILVSVYELAAHVSDKQRYLTLVSHMSAALNFGMVVGIMASAAFGLRNDYMSAAMVPVGASLLAMATSLMFVFTWRRSWLSGEHH